MASVLWNTNFWYEQKEKEMSEYSTGLIHGILLSVIADVISNFITILIVKHIFTKSNFGSIFNIIKKIFRNK